MTLNEVRQLHNGDEVWWDDPEGLTSRSYNIRLIRVVGEVVTIMDVDGSVLECFASELR